MKKFILVAAFTVFTSNIVLSQEVESERMEAPSDYVISLLSLCKDYAAEEEVEKADTDKFLLICINDELEESDYKPINSLPKEE